MEAERDLVAKQAALGKGAVIGGSALWPLG